MYLKAFILVFSILMLALGTPGGCRADDEFPIAGTYTENTPCDRADAAVVHVKITDHDIDSPVLGLCAILEKRREGDKIFVHLECKGPGGGSMLGDVIFAMKGTNALDFADQDNTYKAVLYKCSN